MGGGTKENPISHWGKGAPRFRTKGFWTHALKWNREAERKFEVTKETYGRVAAERLERPRIFPSLCDWLDEEVPIEWLADFLDLIRKTPNLDWLLLTKRPENWEPRLRAVAVSLQDDKGSQVTNPLWQWLHNWIPWNGIHRHDPPANVWIGASVEDQPYANERCVELLKIPAAVHFLSVEPLLGGIDLTACRFKDDDCEIRLNALTGETWVENSASPSAYCDDNKGVDWVIIGGESGSGARMCNVEWIRNIVQQCKAAKVPVFVKQLGARPYWNGTTHTLTAHSQYLEFKDKKGGDISEWPKDLQVREYPHL
jgi:protein gp37